MNKDLIISKYKELEPFLRHNPVCQLMQDYSEAFQAMANTPECYRNEEYQEAFKNLQIQSNTCTCGLEKLKSELSLLQEQEKEPEINPLNCATVCIGPDCEGCRNYTPIPNDYVKTQVTQSIESVEQSGIREKLILKIINENVVKHQFITHSEFYGTDKAAKEIAEKFQSGIRDELIKFIDYIKNECQYSYIVSIDDSDIDEYLKSNQ